MHNKFAAFSASAIAHELGHANNAIGRSTGKSLGMAVMHRLLPKFVGGRTARSLTVALSKKNGTRRAAILGGLSQVPILIEEGRASLKGMKYLRKVGLNPKEMSRAKKTLLGAYGTYGASAASAVAEPLLAKQLYKGMLKLQPKSVTRKQQWNRLKDKVIDPGTLTKLRRKLIYAGDTGGRSALGEYARQSVASLPGTFAKGESGKYLRRSMRKGRKVEALSNPLIAKLQRAAGLPDLPIHDGVTDAYATKINPTSALRKLYADQLRRPNYAKDRAHEAHGSIFATNQH